MVCFSASRKLAGRIEQYSVQLLEKTELLVVGDDIQPLTTRNAPKSASELTRLILGNDLPAPRDAILLSWIHGCQFSESLFAELDLKAHQSRIQTLPKTDLIGREVSVATINSLDVLSRTLSAMSASL